MRYSELISDCPLLEAQIQQYFDWIMNLFFVDGLIAFFDYHPTIIILKYNTSDYGKVHQICHTTPVLFYYTHPSTRG